MSEQGDLPSVFPTQRSPPPTTPPPGRTHSPTPSAPNLLQLIKYLEDTRHYDEERREQERKYEEEERGTGEEETRGTREERGDPRTCQETQLKMIILMGIKDAELVQKLISMDPSSSLNDVVTACHAHEAARRTTTAISAPNQLVQAVSTYKNQKKKNQGHIKDPPNKESPALPAAACHSCKLKEASARE
ncbi:hypothetical protein Pcinc_003068 [Petrolisthes cinctipes]|uniref:Uncharacterized protein n=1 Tax=Petrolisthes cinctipes TaxID=88211 RepID=A0AAE1GJJ7_PETCI|nr:hypothetical protein Pcinc_003068 [Petrolisthes cinctipes]